MEKIYDTIVIGAGPAGITAAIYLKRANFDILLIEKDAPGGQINKTSTIENYPGVDKIAGSDLASKLYKQTKDLEIDYKYGEAKVIEDKGEYKAIKLQDEELLAKTVILALGKKPKTLRKEETEKLIGHGISFCAVCDGALYKNKDVAVIGGGNSALEEALYLSKICNNVYIIHRRDEMRGDEILVDSINNKDNIKVLYNSEVMKFNERDGILDSLDIKTNEEIKELKVSGCFIFVGYEPATEFLKDLDILDDFGFVEVNDKKETKIKGIFAAGDVVKKEAYQIVTATSDGALAAIGCIKKLG